MTWRIWSPVGSTSSSNASFERGFSSDAASALDDKRKPDRQAVKPLTGPPPGGHLVATELRACIMSAIAGDARMGNPRVAGSSPASGIA